MRFGTLIWCRRKIEFVWCIGLFVFHSHLWMHSAYMQLHSRVPTIYFIQAHRYISCHIEIFCVFEKFNAATAAAVFYHMQLLMFFSLFNFILYFFFCSLILSKNQQIDWSKNDGSGCFHFKWSYIKRTLRISDEDLIWYTVIEYIWTRESNILIYSETLMFFYFFIRLLAILVFISLSSVLQKAIWSVVMHVHFNIESKVHIQWPNDIFFSYSGHSTFWYTLLNALPSLGWFVYIIL